MYFDDILTGKSAQSTITSQNPPQQGSGYFGDIFGTTPSQQAGSQVTADINPISRLFSNEKPGQKRISAYTPLDYLLNSAVYGGAGVLENSFKKAKAIKKRKQTGEKVPLLEQIVSPNVLNPENWSGALENLKPENRKTAFDVTTENLPGNPYAAAVSFVGDLGAPTVPVAKIAKIAKLDKVADLVKETKVAGQVAEKIKPAVNALKYRGGQPQAYVQKAEEALKATRTGIEESKRIATLLSEGLTQGQQIRLGQIMKGGVTTAKTDTDLIKRATEARKVIDNLSGQLAEQAMRGGRKEVTSKGLAADLVNTLIRSFKKPDPTLGITEKGWRSPDELSMELLDTFKKYQPAHIGDMIDKTIITASGDKKTVKAFQDIGADVRGKVASTRGGEEIVKGALSPEGIIPQMLPVPASAPDKFKPTAFSQVSEGFSPVEGSLGVSKKVAEGLPQKLPPRPDLLPVETVQRDAVTGGVKINDQTLQTIESNVGKYLPRLYRKYEKNPEGLVKFLNTNKGKIVRDRFMKKTDIPDDIRAAMGEILEPAYPAGKAIAQMSDTIAKSKLFRWTNDNFAQVAEAPGLIKLGDDAGFGILAGKYVPEAIAKDITGMVIRKAPGAIEGVYKKALGAWKTGKILLNPATRARNQISNMALMNIVGDMPSYEVVNPARWVDAAKELKSQGAFYQILKKETDLLDDTFYGNEIAPFLDNFINNQQQGNAFQRFMGSAKSFVGDSYNIQEQLGKMVLVKYLIEQGASIKEAGKLAEDTLFNYSKVPDLVKKLRDVPFGYPFITFQYFAVPAMAKTFVNKPQRLARLTRTGMAIETQAKNQLGSVDKKESLPDYMQNGQYLRLPFQDKGQDLYLDLNYLLPWGSIMERPDVIPGEPQNPVYTLAADLFRNKSGFTQKEIWKETDSSSEKAKKAGDYVYKALMPSFAPGGFDVDSPTRGGYSFQKVIDAWRQRPDYFDRVRSIPTVLTDVLLGLKATPIDYAQTRRVKEGERIGQLKGLQEEIRLTTLDNRLFPEEKERRIRKIRQKIQGLSSK